MIYNIFSKFNFCLLLIYYNISYIIIACSIIIKTLINYILNFLFGQKLILLF